MARQLEAHASTFDQAGYCALDYIASIGLEDAQIIAAEEICMDAKDANVFLRCYKTCREQLIEARDQRAAVSLSIACMDGTCIAADGLPAHASVADLKAKIAPQHPSGGFDLFVLGVENALRDEAGGRVPACSS